MMRETLFSFLLNNKKQVDTNKTLAFMGATIGGIVLIIAALQQHTGMEWLLAVYLVATMGQLPSKGLNDLGKLRIEQSKKTENEAD